MAILNFQSCVIVLSIAFLSNLAYNYYYRDRKMKKTVKRKEVHEVLMFSNDLPQMTPKKSKYSRCIISAGMEKLLSYLNTARYKLDICMYVFTNLDIANMIVKLHIRGVQIRVIIDADMAFASGSHVRKLEKHGIRVRWMKSTNIMHHKFCLVDALLLEDPLVLPLLMSGSLNWTNQALCGNWEDVLVTSQRELVEQYRIEFDRLWLLFKPIVK